MKEYDEVHNKRVECIMADHQAEEGDVYVYTGGRAPHHITHAIIDKSVNEIDDEAFYRNTNLRRSDNVNTNLRYVKTHDGLEKIGRSSFSSCINLTNIDIRSVKILEEFALAESGLREVDCDKLEILERFAFSWCQSLTRISLPRAKIIGVFAFGSTALTEVELPEAEQIQANAFRDSSSLRRIAIPLKADLFDSEPEPDDSDIEDEEEMEATAFYGCDSLVQVDLVGGIHDTISSLHHRRWKIDMNNEIRHINLVLPSIPSDEKTAMIKWWLASVSRKIEHYKREHNRRLKEAATILALACWKVNLLDDESEETSLETKAKKVKIDVESARKLANVTCGADIIIKNVMPFLQLGQKTGRTGD